MTLHPPLRRELPFLVIEIALLVVLLHANAPEVWFWFAVLVVVLVLRGWSWIWRRRERQGAAEAAALSEAGSTKGSDTGAVG